MKTIILFPAICLPIPSIKGGAVEALITDLIDQNEIHKLYNFVVVSGWCEGIEEIQAKYKRTTFIVIKKRFYDDVFYFVYKAIRKLSKRKIAPLFLCSQNYRAFLQIKKLSFDYLICEGGYNFRSFYDMSKTFGKERMLCHLHSVFSPGDYFRDTFSGYIAISQFVKDRWESGLQQENTPTYVLRNCININKFLANKESVDVRKKYGIPHDAFLIAYVGRIIPVKGVEQLINAFLKCNIPNKHLLLIGSTNYGSPEISNYESRIQKKVKHNVDIITATGFVPNDLLSAFLSRADLIVMPSLCQEGAGLVAIEALATGVEFLVTNSGGVGEFARDGYCHKISKDEYFKQAIPTDIQDKHILETDWTEFEAKLCQTIEKIASRKIPKPKDAWEYLNEFDCKQYYQNFDNMISKIDNDSSFAS